MDKIHHYKTSVKWTGNQGSGTMKYDQYGRDHIISVKNKPDIPGSSDPSFRGDKNRYNPEDMFVASLSTCHMLWYLHLCCNAGVIVEDYFDTAEGFMTELADGSGYFTEVILNPTVVIAHESMKQKALLIHSDIHHYCFIARSVNFPVSHRPKIIVKNRAQ